MLAVAVCLLGTGAARAQALEPAGVDGEGPELVVGISDLAGQLNRPAGRSLRRFAAEFGAFTRTTEAWEGLSRALGMTPDAAVERLLGGRTLLLADGIGSNGFRWAFVMSVDKSIGRLVTRRLKGAPRSAIDGKTVYAIEDGRFRVAHVEPEMHGGPTVLAIAHVGAEGLLRAGLEMSTGWRDAPAAKGASGPVIYRPAGGGAIVGEIASVDDGWRFEFGVAGAGGRRAAALRDGRASATFEALAERSVVAYSGPVTAEGDRDPGLGLLGPEEVVWLLWKFGRPAEFQRPRDGSPVFVSMESVGGGLLDCSLWAGVSDLTLGAAAGDAYMCRVLGEFSDTYGPGKDAPECTGWEPEAARELTIKLDPAKSSYGQLLSVTWGPACTGGASGCSWWGMRVATVGGLEAISRRPPTLPGSARGGGKTPSRGALAQVRPAGLVDMLGEDEAGIGVIGALRWIDTVRWEIDRGADGRGASGVFTVRMTRDE